MVKKLAKPTLFIKHFTTVKLDQSALHKVKNKIKINKNTEIHCSTTTVELEVL